MQFLLLLLVFLWPMAIQIHAQKTITIRPDEFVRLGTAIEHPSYDYGPTIIRDDDGVYKMWWCASDISQDGIFYADSTDGIHWNQRGRVLQTLRPPQGTHACDPSVVKANNNYYLYYTSEGAAMGAGTSNSIYLGYWDTSAYPTAQKWIYPNNGNPVITSTQWDGTYGIGQSSVLFLDNRFIQFYTNTIGGQKILVAQSTNGGTVFTPLNDGRPIITNATAVDVKYFPTLKKYLVIAEKPQWTLRLFVLNDTYQVIKRATFAPEALPNHCNHNPGLLGDRRGVALDVQNILVYFGSGSYKSGTDCWNPESWDIPVYRLNLERLLGDPSPTPTPSPTTIPSLLLGDLNADGKVPISDYNLLVTNFGKTGSAGFTSADINKDGKIDSFDYNQLVGSF